MKCVECGEQTEQRLYEGVTADVCAAGHGMWLSSDELLRVVRTDPASVGQGSSYEEESALYQVLDHDVEPGDHVRDCPMCGKPMGSVRYAFSTDVVVDGCKVHGIWLDAGELEALESWAAARYSPDSEEGRRFRERADARETAAADPRLNTLEGRVSVFGWLRAQVRR